MARDDVDALAEQVLAARKYAALDPTLVRGVLAAELAKGRRGKVAVKAAKTKLHQIAAVYQTSSLDYAGWRERLESAAARPEELQVFCLEAMQAHTSTRERLPILAEFYATIFTDLPPAPLVIDLACGLNPLALAWMPLPPGYRYWACDIDREQIDFLNDFFARTGAPAAAHLYDLIHGDSAAVPTADIVLLLKTIPCLEQIDSSIGARLLAALDCRTAFVSFPTRSLGGKSRGMASHYSEHFAQIAPPGYTVRRYEFANELVFRLDREA
jgi:16S rRNA (guanine(1405)-N(7))-methyltransferase